MSFINKSDFANTIDPSIRRGPAALAAALAAFTAAAMVSLPTVNGQSPTEETKAYEPPAAVAVFTEPAETREFVRSTSVIPHGSVTVYDETKYSDEVEITRPGADGLACMTTLVIHEGESEERFPIESHTLVEPIDEIVTVGSIPGSRYDSRGYYIWPTTGVISSGFGGRNIAVGSSNHQGIDIANSVGTDVWAADGGEVIYAQDSGSSGYGNLIKILHDDGAVTYYAHLDKILVEVGQRVAQGDIIAQMGRTGRVTGPHLHFEIRPNGSDPKNPVSYLDGKPERG